MTHPIIEVALNPDAFFRKRADRPPELKVPALIVLITGIIGGIGAYMTTNLIAPAFPPEVQGIMGVAAIVAAVGAVVFSLIVWVVIAVLFYGVSSVLGGSGDLKKTIEATGYGYVPEILGSLMSLALTIQFASSFALPQIDFNDPAAVTALQESITHSPMMMAAVLISIVFLLWSANIWVYGVKYARHLSLKNAAISVGVPVAIYIIYQIITLGVV
ncbi:Yip1 family protein [Methanofollis fontis]|uniref:Yip1 domain-containing protein n=1 Tax=Methanofollis fontis TaxID=2052832 RepID=A0A483CT67_9EURY|nr:Yip1 family protein [Methanofollis fontis]TAJ45544.1 hypothetical protein CUJ86_02120 [Methanofollis fontis]